MEVQEADIPGLLVIQPKVFRDGRGYFYESWSEERYRAAGIRERFVQDNRSVSLRGVLRGLHYTKRHPQGQLVWVVEGAVYDVCVDLRRGSPTYGRWFGTVLDELDAKQVYMPPGFAHGFYVLGERAAVHYKCTNIYRPDDEGGLLWSDPAIGIAWPVSDPLVSVRDSAYPTLDAVGVDELPHVSFG
jgi:dTDP-4-dehydrorhamnose 3,5-epimerase